MLRSSHLQFAVIVVAGCPFAVVHLWMLHELNSTAASQKAGCLQDSLHQPGTGMKCSMPSLASSYTSCNTQENGLQQLRRYVRDCPTVVAAATAAGPAAAHHVSQHTHPPKVDYITLLDRHKQGGCPALFLAPMENLADRPARIALKQAIGECALTVFNCRHWLKTKTHHQV